MKTVLGLVLALSLPCLADDLVTEHYELRVEGLDAKEVGAMLEQLHAQLTDWFGTTPSAPLRLSVDATRERYLNALLEDRQPAQDSGGYYSPQTRKAYLYVQPSAYFTRQLILHEATHQFHYLAATGNLDPPACWYAEGLAEYFGMHNWDGKTLATGVVPSITLEDYPAVALQHMDAMGEDLQGMIAGTLACDRPESWAFFHYLQDHDPKRFRSLTRGLDKGEDPWAAWQRSFGPVRDDLSRNLRNWIVQNSQPWRVVWTGWQARGEALEGSSRTNALVVLKETPSHLAVRIEPVEGAPLAGLVFGFKSADEFFLVQVVPGRKGRVVQRKGGQWRLLMSTDIPTLNTLDEVTISSTREGVSAAINGKTLGTFEALGQVGLSCDNCKVLFHVTSP